MTLGELEINDRFYPKSKVGKATPIFLVIGEKVFNPRHGSATRMCYDLQHKIQVSKSCRLEVIKTQPKKSDVL